jgi:hypothetical protein
MMVALYALDVKRPEILTEMTPLSNFQLIECVGMSAPRDSAMYPRRTMVGLSFKVQVTRIGKV